LATGHFRNGILLAPITAQLIADCIAKGKVSDLIRPFSVDRFLEESWPKRGTDRT
jgi:glycine/D-amino acid oxidase-like deaminating enzyme